MSEQDTMAETTTTLQEHFERLIIIIIIIITHFNCNPTFTLSKILKYYYCCMLLLNGKIAFRRKLLIKERG